jgi:beta-1,4-mannosyl-glycoprotein beta-1,4-N-acetylglucosaminyltransferase
MNTTFWSFVLKFSTSSGQVRPRRLRLNHVGGPKELFFQKNKERFAKWLHKIEHVIVTGGRGRPRMTNPCVRAGKVPARVYSRAGSAACQTVPIVMVSDVDEIPDHATECRYEKLPHLMNFGPYVDVSSTRLDYLFTGEPWFGTCHNNRRDAQARRTQRTS